MTDLICRKSMTRCLTPGVCSPHDGCQPDKTEWQSGYDEGRRMGTKHMYAEVDRLKAENEALRKHQPSVEVIWCACGDGHAANSYGAGFMDANGGVCANCDAAMGKGEQS